MRILKMFAIAAMLLTLWLQGPVKSTAQSCTAGVPGQTECLQDDQAPSSLVRQAPSVVECSPDAECSSDYQPAAVDSAYRLYFPLVAKPGYHPVSTPIGINCGGPTTSLSTGRQFLEDLPYAPNTGMGSIGGMALAGETTWEDINNTDDDTLFRTGRSGVEEYRFDVANGTYLVELSLAEIKHHGPDLRRYSVSIESQPVIADLDLYALAQHDYAVRYRFATEVLDRQLNVTLSSTTGQTLVNAIWITRRTPDVQPPAAPSPVNIVGGYREVLIRWATGQEDDVAGHHVYRAASADGPFIRVTASPIPLTRYFDRDVAVGSRHCYRISAVDVFGNEGGQSAAQCATVVDYDATALPVLRLSIDPDDLMAMNVNPWADVEVEAMLEQDGASYEVEAKYRGASTRFSNKKSWKLTASQPFAYSGQKTLLLNGEGHDAASIRDKLSYDLFQDIGVLPLQASFVDLDLNGRFIGVFTQVENPDAEFLRRTGRNETGDVFKCSDGLDVQPECTNEIADGRHLEDLYDFAAIVNRTPDAEFASAIADVLDVREFLDYQAGKALTADLDSAHQYLLVAPTAAGKWQVLPWDNDVSFAGTIQGLDFGTEANPAYGYQFNVLLTRVLEVPQYRRYYGDRILELVDGLFSSSAMASRLADIREQVWFDLERDVWKTHRENNDRVRERLDLLQVFVNRRITYLRSAVPAFVPAQRSYVAINEAMSRNVNTLLDPADGQAEPWFELFNAGVTPIDLGGMYISDDPAVPRRFRFASGVLIPALSGLVFWADNEPEQGSNHVNFRLYGNGGQLRLTAADGVTMIDTLAIPPLPIDVSLARFPDQSGSPMSFTHPTPGQPNRLPAPVITDVAHSPGYPQAGEAATVRARLTDDDHVAHAELIYVVEETPTTVVMFDDGQHNDGGQNDDLYAAQIPGMPQGTVVTYYIAATDATNRVSHHPFAAPTLTHQYRVGFLPPPVAISEFMADNATTIMDPDEPDEYPDWIEVTNLTQEPVDLSGYYLSDKRDTPMKYRIPNGTMLAAGEAAIFWADDDGTQGPFHSNFKLSADGEAVALTDRDGVTPISAIEFGPQLADVSYGLCPLPDGWWDFHYLPTPGAGNACGRLYLPSAAVD